MSQDPKTSLHMSQDLTAYVTRPKALILPIWASHVVTTPVTSRFQHMAVRLYTAVLVSGYNAADPSAVCTIGSRHIPTPGPGEVVVRMLCRPVNPSDILALQGLYSGWQPKSFPAVPGLEGMGIIDQLGENVTNIKVGQRVFPMNPGVDETGQGSWQEYIVGPAISQICIPDSVSDEVASQFLINPWTVYAMFHELKIPRGEYVIQTAAASVLGRMFIQYCRFQGVKTINLVRRNEQKEELKSLGADEVINYVEEEVVEEVKKITQGRLAFGAIDSVGGNVTKLVGSCVRNGAVILNYGVLGADHVEVNSQDLLFREVKLHGFYLTPWIGRLSPQELLKVGGEVMSLLEKKIIQPLSGQKYPLESVKEAITKSQESARGGKVFLVSR